MRYLARREHTRAELHAKLLPHVPEGEDVGAVLDELEKRRWLSDARAAKAMVDAKRMRFGAKRIVHELRQKGVAENLIDESLTQLKGTELAAARVVWQKKFGKVPENEKKKAKQIRYIMSRGFSLEVAFKVLRETDTIDQND